MKEIKITKPQYPGVFGGAGFHNNDATMYHIIDEDHFNQYICKCYREISPGFMRTFAGFDDWTKEAMDEFADYYEKMQKWTDTPMYLTPGAGKRHFSDEEITAYCEDVAKRLAYLYYEKNVGHIRYYCFSNEMSCSMWGVLLKDLPLFKKYHEGLYAAFQRHKLPIGLLATDASGYESWKTVDWAIENMADVTEDFCVHIYERDYDIHNLDFYEFFYDKCKEYVDKAIICFGKRLILGEIGIQKNQGQITFYKNVVLDVNRYFADKDDEAYCALMLTEMAYAAINAGVYALVWWTFVDHPAPYSCAYSSGDDEYAVKWGEAERFFSTTADTKYNKWGVLKWDDESGDYGARAPYWALSLLAKFFRKNSSILEVETDDENLRICGVRNRDKSVTVGIVNRNKNATSVKLSSELFNKEIRVYEYDSKNVPFNKFADMQSFSAVLSPNDVSFTLKGDSITYFTTDYLSKEKTVEAQIENQTDSFVSWSEVDDKNHCYYRVYTSDEKDFVPGLENQIASTVATSLKSEEIKKYCRVLSVDKSGNV